MRSQSFFLNSSSSSGLSAFCFARSTSTWNQNNFSKKYDFSLKKIILLAFAVRFIIYATYHSDGFTLYCKYWLVRIINNREITWFVVSKQHKYIHGLGLVSNDLVSQISVWYQDFLTPLIGARGICH